MAPERQGADAIEVLEAALRQVYADQPAPSEIFVPIEIDSAEREALELWLSSGAGRAVRISVPRRGDRRGLLELATRNSAMAYQAEFGDGTGAALEALETLQSVLALPTLPRRIECFDISTLQGRETVASMVVCVEGKMRKGEYRKFTIKGLGDVKPDDFAAMQEVVLRRYRAVLEQGGQEM